MSLYAYDQIDRDMLVDRAAEFRDHGLRVGQLLAKRVDVIIRRHTGLNTAGWSGA